MKPIIAAPLVAVVLAGAGLGAYFAVATEGNGGEEQALAEATPTQTPTEQTSATPTPEPTDAPTQAGGKGGSAVDDHTPEGWTTYVDPVLGFSLRYPPDLASTDVTPSPTSGIHLRAIEFRSPKDASRAFVISVSANPKGLTLEQWAFEYAGCRPESIQQGMLGGIRAIVCTREVVEGQHDPAALAEHAGRIFLISGNFTDSEFTQITGGFHF